MAGTFDRVKVNVFPVDTKLGGKLKGSQFENLKKILSRQIPELSSLKIDIIRHQ